MEKIAYVTILAAAEAELLEAVRWYNEQGEGLGLKFAAEVFRTIERIVRYPEAWGALSKRTRRCRTNRYPFAVVYQVRRDQILIVSVMHMSREPNSWRRHLPSSHK